MDDDYFVTAVINEWTMNFVRERRDDEEREECAGES